MESVGRMTRSRAKALGATPMAALPTKTPEPRTTGRRGRKAAVQSQELPPQESAPKQLQFQGEVPNIEQLAPASSNGDREASAAPSPDQNAPARAQESCAMQLGEADAHAETHDNPSVLMASPIILTAREQQISASVAPLPIDLDTAAAVPEVDVSPSQVPSTPADDDSSQADGSPIPFDELVPAATPQPAGTLAAAPEIPQPVAGSPVSVVVGSPMLSPLSLAASPLPSLSSPQSMTASPLPAAMSPMPVEASPLPAAMSPMDASPLGGHFNHRAAAPSPLLGAAAIAGSPLATITPLSFTSDAPRNGTAASVQPLPASIPASPLSLTEEAVDQAVFSPMPEDGQCSPISLSGGADVTPQPAPPLMPLLDDALEEDLHMEQDGDDDMMAEATPWAEAAGPDASSPLTFASDRRAVTPGTAPSPAPAFVGVPPDSVPHASASPAPVVSSFQGFAAVFPTPAGSELEPGSPTLAGLMSAAATAPSPSPSMLLMSAGVGAAIAPSQETAVAVHAAASATDQPPSAQCFSSAPSTAALTTPILGTDAHGSSDIVTAHCTTLSSPADGAGMPPAPAPTPECGSVQGWTLTQTPLANALAVSLTANAEARCESVDQGMEAEADAPVEAETQGACDSQQQPIGSPLEDMAMEDQEPQQAVEPIAPSPAPQPAAQPTPIATAAKTPSLQARSPALGPVVRTAAGTPKISTKAATPSTATGANIPRSGASYVNVESRYNKTPTTTGATAAKARHVFSAAGNGASASTPMALTNATAGAKSVKRVSIHTPEGPRSAAPLRQVVPTPFRPKLANTPEQLPALEPPQPPQLPADEAQQPTNPQAAAAADERRVKAAERLKAIHVSEQAAPAARAPSGPGYLAPTRAFAVKSVKSKVETAGYDSRSLRQLKREVKEAVAKKEAKAVLHEARPSKLTPKVAERQLPMPDDDEGSDDQAEYNEGQENDLVAAMSALEVAPPKNTVPVALRGLPAPQGKHIRFNDKGKASESPKRTVLRGLPVAIGKYKRFD